MDFAIYKFPYGFLKIGYQGDTLKILQRTQNPIDNDRKTDFTDLVYKEIIEYLNGERISFDFPYELEGTDFQKKVWKELARIPYGETRTYKEIASAIGNKNASRAVGMANNKNPIMIVVPCHRVIGGNGKLVGYAGGIDMKKDLLDLEQRVREKIE